jgi:hypothetical protein
MPVLLIYVGILFNKILLELQTISFSLFFSFNPVQRYDEVFAQTLVMTWAFNMYVLGKK